MCMIQVRRAAEEKAMQKRQAQIRALEAEKQRREEAERKKREEAVQRQQAEVERKRRQAEEQEERRRRREEAEVRKKEEEEERLRRLKEAEELLSRAGVDKVVLLSHLGYEFDLRIAEEVAGPGWRTGALRASWVRCHAPVGRHASADAPTSRHHSSGQARAGSARTRSKTARRRPPSSTEALTTLTRCRR